MRRTPGLFIRLPELGMPWFPFLCIVFQVSLNWIGHCLLRVRVVSRVAPTVGDHFAVTYGLPWPPIPPLENENNRNEDTRPPTHGVLFAPRS